MIIPTSTLILSVAITIAVAIKWKTIGNKILKAFLIILLNFNCKRQ